MPGNGRSVAVTGVGVVSPAGNDIATFWKRMVDGDTAIGPLRGVPTERFSCRLAAEVLDFQPSHHFDRRQLPTLDRFSQFAVVAARQAISDSGLRLTDEERENVAIIIGSGIGGINTLDESFLKLYGERASRLHPLTIPKMMINGCACQVSMDLGLKGEAYTVASACASATHAIGQAFRMIRAGAADVVLTGGSEACLNPGSIKAWEALRVMSDEACRPFSANRSGMVLGEGAAILVLEEYDKARRRGAAIYGLVAGYGASSDASELTSPSVEGAGRAIAAALQSAKLGVDDVDYINAHGTGTTANDAAEAKAIRVVFGQATDRLLVSSSKAVLGHCLGAAGALGGLVSLLALRDGIAPPTAGWQQADPDCDLDVVPNVARRAGLRAALSNSLAFGGLNAVLAFTRA
jgi:nodulation protein E